MDGNWARNAKNFFDSLEGNVAVQETDFLFLGNKPGDGAPF